MAKKIVILYNLCCLHRNKAGVKIVSIRTALFLKFEHNNSAYEIESFDQLKIVLKAED